MSTSADRNRRDKIRETPGLGHAWRCGVFLAGLFFICAGIALAALPGPLTIPPVLFGLWLWSTEFAFADRFFQAFKQKGQEAWDQARERPVLSSLVTGGGMIAAGVAFWAGHHYHVVHHVRSAIF